MRFMVKYRSDEDESEVTQALTGEEVLKLLATVGAEVAQTTGDSVGGLWVLEIESL